jgi:toxin ParE1/3/4
MIICKRHVIIYKVIDLSVYIYHIADSQTEYTRLFH